MAEKLANVPGAQKRGAAFVGDGEPPATIAQATQAATAAAGSRGPNFRACRFGIVRSPAPCSRRSSLPEEAFGAVTDLTTARDRLGCDRAVMACYRDRGMTRPIRIIGIDPGLRRTGWGVVESAGNRLELPRLRLGDDQRSR